MCIPPMVPSVWTSFTQQKAALAMSMPPADWPL
jgi:hypothetical protein